MLDRRNPLAGMKLAAAAAQLAQIALQEGVGVEADAVAVGDAVGRVILEQRTKLVDPGLVEPLKRGKGGQLGLKRVERRALILARVDQNRHAPPERDVAEAGRRIIEEGPAGQGQCPHQPVAERVMEHGRAAAGRVIADLLFGLEHCDASMVRQCGSGGEPGDPTADDQDVGAHRQERLGLRDGREVRHLRTVGRTGRACSLSQNADRKLYRLRANKAEASAARPRARLTAPMILTPCLSTVSPLTVPSTLPPASAARSTMMLPGRIEAI